MCRVNFKLIVLCTCSKTATNRKKEGGKQWQNSWPTSVQTLYVGLFTLSLLGSPSHVASFFSCSGIALLVWCSFSFVDYAAAIFGKISQNLQTRSALNVAVKLMCCVVNGPDRTTWNFLTDNTFAKNVPTEPVFRWARWSVFGATLAAKASRPWPLISALRSALMLLSAKALNPLLCIASQLSPCLATQGGKGFLSAWTPCQSPVVKW